MSEAGTGGQLELLRAGSRPRGPRPPESLATELPVARVAVDVPLPHLDRPFDYGVPQSMAEAARPGVRVRVRFAGQDVDGFVLERASVSDHPGPLTPLRRVVSPEPVLTSAIHRLARAVADRYAGTLADVLRLAIPPRHARTEKLVRDHVAGGVRSPAGGIDGPWREYRAGDALIRRLAAGESPRAVWTALPGPRAWADALAVAVEATLASGRGALLVLPDRRDVDTVEDAVRRVIGSDRHVRLEAELGPAARYRAFLALVRGHARVAIGTRAAQFAPVPDLGLVVVWDDGDDNHAEPRAPYPHVREVLTLRSQLEGAALLAGGWSRTADCAAWIRSGWAREVVAERAVLRARWAPVTVAGSVPGADDDPAAAARLPAPAWRAVREGLGLGPVLVQVPRAGYVPGLACQTCRRPARCGTCHGPVELQADLRADVAGGAHPVCGWCGRSQTGWTCPHCGGHRFRARSVGVDRTAEELGRAFPGVPVVVPRAGAAAPSVPRTALVVATPGLEPGVPDGYAAAALLDGHVLLDRPDLRASEDALRRWLAAAALVRPGSQGGRVVVCADPQVSAVQALVRADPGWFAARELDEREQLGLPPAVCLASALGPADAVRRFSQLLAVPPDAEVLGPAPLSAAQDGAAARLGGDDASVRLLVRAPNGSRAALARAVREAAAARSARRDPGSVRVQLDPRDIG